MSEGQSGLGSDNHYSIPYISLVTNQRDATRVMAVKSTFTRFVGVVG